MSGKWTKDKIWTETSWTKNHYSDVLERSLNMLQDPNKKERLDQQECKMCFYSSHIGGSCMTKYKCKNCDKELLSGSTRTNTLCLDCAKELGYRISCGGDIDMKIKRGSK